MKIKLAVMAALACALFAGSANAAPDSRQTAGGQARQMDGGQARTVYVKCGRLIFDAERDAVENAAVIIVDGKITAVGKDLAVPSGAEQVDLSKYTVIPGLIDSHIHLWTGASSPEGQDASDALAVLRASKAMSYALSSGIVAARVLGSGDFIDVALHDAIEEGTIPGPHLLPAGHALSIPAGHADHFTFPLTMPLEDYYTPLHGFINSPADAEKAVHLQIKYGARVIKVLASGGVGSPLDSPTAEQLSPEELRVIVEQAHMDHLKVAAHDENLMTILAALHAGVDSIEHGSELNQEAIDYMKEHHVVLVPTVYIVDNILANGERLHMPDYMLRKAHELAAKHFASFKLAVPSGVTIAAGSDQAYQPGAGTVRDEIMTEVKYGMTPQAALLSGTKTAAALLGFDQLGILAAGKEGDLVAVEGDPRSDIHALEKVRAVIFQGKQITPANR